MPVYRKILTQFEPATPEVEFLRNRCQCPSYCSFSSAALMRQHNISERFQANKSFPQKKIKLVTENSGMFMAGFQKKYSLNMTDFQHIFKFPDNQVGNLDLQSRQHKFHSFEITQ
jgi:hypothetical protein